MRSRCRSAKAQPTRANGRGGSGSATRSERSFPVSDLAARAAKMQQAMADRQKVMDATTAITVLAKKSSVPLCAAVSVPAPADDTVQSGKVKSAKQLMPNSQDGCEEGSKCLCSTPSPRPHTPSVITDSFQG